jgi:hypothetical protein
MRVFFVGDSIVRETLRAIGTLVATPATPPPEFTQNFDVDAATPCNGTLAFRWRPFADDVTEWLEGSSWAGQGLEKGDQDAEEDYRPGLLVLGVGLWDMLYRDNVTAYAASLNRLFAALGALVSDEVCIC